MLKQLLNQMPEGWQMDTEMRAWDQMEPVGREFGAIEVWEEDGLFVARCNDPEVASEGGTKEQAVANLREAISLYYENNNTHISLTRRITPLED